jgi:hypothetical protein
MTYAVSAALQSALYGRLASDSVLAKLVGSSIYDGVPPGKLPPTYVSLGEERVLDRSDADQHGAWHEFEIAIVTDDGGFAIAKAAAGAITDALLGTPLDLDRGEVVGLWFRQAHARRMRRSGTRRIDLRFRAQVYDTNNLE